MDKKVILSLFLVFALVSFVSALENCQDSDNGVNLETKGTLSLFYPNGSLYQTYEDACYDSSDIKEYACGHPSEPDSIDSRYTCQNGCSNGECINETTPNATCEDSDGGLNYFVRGMANSTDNGYGWDSCLDDNFQSNEVVHYNGSVIKAGTGTKISEVYCDENNLFASKVVDCEFGCIAGACLKSAYLGEKAVTNIHNMQDTPMTCPQICAKYGSKVAEKGCYDINFDKCTLLRGSTCILNIGDEEDEPSELEYLVEKDYSTSCCCENVVLTGCSSTDGIDPFTKGRTTDSQGYVREDRCNNQILEDYHCSEDGGATFFSNLICPNGCEDGACIPCNGCISDNKCFNFGYRKGVLFCSLEIGKFIEQLSEGQTCEDNYECKDNICIDGKCIELGFWQKFINWFKNLFG